MTATKASCVVPTTLVHQITILAKRWETYYIPHTCPAGTVKVAGALLRYSTLPNEPDHSVKLCSNWPVDPKYLWQKYYNDSKTSDVVWKYSDDYQNNDQDDERSTEEDSSDAYGFVMLDGPKARLIATLQPVTPFHLTDA
ncbi:hypothetical protein EYZ11_013483 [Aspergillus tanneri]|uniref:Uncharacterized protein n=1 Tax=Aspergillus tanneri TaxID=1220188 RepID=A0A4S3J2Z3_9EURO|nr:hypothetical protein EYZ11_013483 [Aspergillus tanneri]